MPKRTKNRKFKFLSSSYFIILGVIILILISFALAKEILRRREINQQITQLKDEISRLGGENQELGNLITYFRTKSFQEKEAREKLGLQKPGEKAIAIPQTIQGEERASVLEKNEEENLSNPKKWWLYFFKSSE